MSARQMRRRRKAEEKTKVTAGAGEKKKNPSQEPLKPRQNLRRSTTGREPERETQEMGHNRALAPRFFNIPTL